MFKQRSSWASSLITGLIGWNGFLIIAGLIMGSSVPPGILFAAGSLAAVLQVVALRLLFFPLRLQRGLGYGAIWGALTAAALILFARTLFPDLRTGFLIWFLTAVYVGPAVGAFLSYFYRDDREIEAGFEPGQPVDYGRDAHWLEPFGFGALAYLVIYLPRSVDLLVSVTVVGAMSGVFAAGASHFVLFSKERNSRLPFVIGLLGGAVQGAVSGWLFRRFADELPAAPMALGAAAGILTYLMTTVRGNTLLQAESKSDEAGEVRESGESEAAATESDNT